MYFGIVNCNAKMFKSLNYCRLPCLDSLTQGERSFLFLDDTFLKFLNMLLYDGTYLKKLYSSLHLKKLKQTKKQQPPPIPNKKSTNVNAIHFHFCSSRYLAFNNMTLAEVQLIKM